MPDAELAAVLDAMPNAEPDAVRADALDATPDTAPAAAPDVDPTAAPNAASVAARLRPGEQLHPALDAAAYVAPDAAPDAESTAATYAAPDAVRADSPDAELAAAHDVEPAAAPNAAPNAAPGVSFDASSNASGLDAFRARVLERGGELYRDLPWRRTRDAYAIWISEVMLQQTQVSRVDGRWQRWLERFPSVDALASAEPADVLEEWQGMGYNRRALALLRAAREIANQGGVLPRDEAGLRALPGIGPATAAGIRAFAYDLPGVYLETNVRTVFLHELYPDAERVPDRELAPLVAACCPEGPAKEGRPGPRTWYYALLDYGAWLKKTVPNPSRRSATHARQGRFEGSHRQKRAQMVRLLLAARPTGAPLGELAHAMDEAELVAGREPVGEAAALGLLEELAREGFCRLEGELWTA